MLIGIKNYETTFGVARSNLFAWLAKNYVIARYEAIQHSQLSIHLYRAKRIIGEAYYPHEV